MKIQFVPIVAMSLGLAAVPAMAADTQGAKQPSSTTSTHTAQQVEASLKQGGFQNVRIVDAAYVVHANAQDGSFVTMMIDPPSAGRETGAAGKQSAATSQQQIKTSLTQAGFKNVAIVDASYLARAQTKGGDQLVMMIDPSSVGTAGSSSPTAESQGGAGQSGARQSGK